jgi:hypothetical protein
MMMIGGGKPAMGMGIGGTGIGSATGGIAVN